MDKIDFKKRDKALYSGKAGRFDRVAVPDMPFLMIDGKGDPGTSEDYARAVAALYGLSYGLKFHSKIKLERDYVVPPLEGLWWADDMAAFTQGERDKWQWTMMIRQPDWISADTLQNVRETVIAKNAKKKDAPTDTKTIETVRFENYSEGLCLQVLHIGPYSEEGPILAELHKTVMPAQGLTFNGHHHEIYLGDPRKTAPEKLKTILRQPVKGT